MKKLLLLVPVFFVISACGGGGGDSTVAGEPTIDSISGTGTDGIVIDSIDVTGTNFESEMDVYLVGTSRTISLDYTLISATKINAPLPTDIEPADYELSIENSIGKATAPLTLLRGETGPQGPSGADGITLAHEYFCNWTGSDYFGGNYSGGPTDVWEFSDGSYFMSCRAGSSGFTDDSSAVTWITASLASSMGYVRCIPMYVMTDYYPSTNTVRYILESDESQFLDVACSTIY
jgi:hypothetical protein